MRALLLLLLAAPCRAVELRSPDGNIRWTEGSASYSFINKKGKKRVQTLPALPQDGEWKRRLLFAEKGDYFCVLDEKVEELGLHLGGKPGPAAAKLAVSASVLRLMRKGGRALWRQRLRDRHFGGAHSKREIPLQIAENGTLAVLLQDGDPHSKSRPVILVIDPRGRKTLELNYTVWSRVDELSLSKDGKRLAVRGLGRIHDKEDWGKAVGTYRLDGAEGWVRGIPQADAETRALRVDPDGWVCCVREGEIFVAFDPGGRRERMEAPEMKRRFGEKP